MKPDTCAAMRMLIRQIRDAIPFGLPEASVCGDSCDGCSMKLLEFMESELEGWERRLDQGVRPNFGDLSRLAGTARNIHKSLLRNGLVEGGPSHQN